MTWIIKFEKKADKEFSKLSKDTQKQICDFLSNKLLVAENPKQLGKPLLHDKSGFWRYRIGKYRLICKLKEKKVTIYIVRIAKRDKVYDL